MSHVPVHDYDHCGLAIRSEIELHLAPSSRGAVDLCIREGSVRGVDDGVPDGIVIASAGDGEDWWYVVVENDEGYLLRFAKCADFILSRDLADIEVRPAENGERAHLVPVLLAGTVLAVVLRMRGSTLLHASAVAIGGGAVAFVGPSGRGKSTIAALMCTAGAGLVTDDVLVVSHGGGTTTCTGGAAELRLRQAAAPIAHNHDASRVRSTADDRTAFAPALTVSGPLPLSTIVVPVPSRDVTRVQIVRMPPETALFALLASPRVYGWRRETDLTREFSALRSVVNDVETYAVAIPWGPPFDVGTTEALFDLVRGAAIEGGGV